MADLLYLVEYSKGDYDDYMWNIAGIFIKKEDAEKLKDHLNKEAEMARKNCPVKYNALMSDKKLNQYYDYWREYPFYEHWNGASVREYPVNKDLTQPTESKQWQIANIKA